MSKLFTGKDSWNGGYFNLLLSFKTLSNKEFKNVINYMWKMPCFNGPFGYDNLEPINQKKIKIKIPDKIDKGIINYGTVKLSNNKIAPCKFYAYFIDDENKMDCFINISIPFGALEELKIFPIGSYPFGNKINHKKWIEELSNFMFKISKIIFDFYKFKKGLMGLIIGDDYNFLSENNYQIPKDRWLSYLINKNGKLKYYPQNVFSGHFS